MTQQDYGFSSVYWAATWAWAKALNATYDFDSVTPLQAALEVEQATEGKRLTSLTWTSRAINAPRDVRGAWLKGAYILARTAQYLGNEGLANLSKVYLENARKGSGVLNQSEMERIYAEAGSAIRGVSGARAYSDGRIKQVLYYLGVQPGGVKSGGQLRNLRADTNAARARQMDPTKEADRAQAEAQAQIEDQLKKAGNKILGAGNKALDALRKARERKKRKERQARMIKYGVGAGVLALVVVFVTSRVTK